MWQSETYGELTIEEIPEKLLAFYRRNLVYGEPMEIAIGTDSQKHAEGTKVVTVVSIVCRGHGGIFFHRSVYKETTRTLKKKLETETYESLETAKALLDLLSEGPYILLLKNCPVSIHIDAGDAAQCQTRDLVKGLTGWVHAMGYECEIKPDSYSASSIADKITK